MTAAHTRILLSLPPGPGLSALRAALMALRASPQPLPADPAQARSVLQGALAGPGPCVAFVDISTPGAPAGLDLAALHRALPAGAARAHVHLTRLAAGHVAASDQRWVEALGFAGLWAEFDPRASEATLRPAVSAVAGALALRDLSPADLLLYTRVLGDAHDDGSPRALVRRHTGLSAEALAARLSERLDIGPRRWRLQTFERCLVGEEAVSWMARHLTLARTDAVAVGQALGRLGLLVHVAHAHPFLDDHLFYRIAWSSPADGLALDETFDALRGADGVPVRDRTHLGETYASCWIGSEAVDWLTARYGIDRVDAWVVLHRLMQFGLVEHVARARPFIDGPFFYRFGGWPSG